MSESELRQAFREITAEVKPAPEPYGRLMKRGRQQTHRRIAGWGATVATGLAVILFGQLGLNGVAHNEVGPTPGPSPHGSPNPDEMLAINAWTRALIDAPTRGSLAADQSFVVGVAEALRGMIGGPQAGLPVKVLFAGDVGEQRIVIAARQNDAYTEQTGIYAAAPKGASVAEVTGDSTRIHFLPLKPFTRASYISGAGPIREAGVGFAPPGCVISTAAYSETPQWQPVPDGNLFTWTEPAGPLLSKVECGGVLRYSGPAADGETTFVVPAGYDGVDAAIAGARGAVPREVAIRILEMAALSRAAGPVKIFFGGALPAQPGSVYLASFPMSSGHWALVIDSHGGAIAVEPVVLDQDPTDPNAVTAFRLGTDLFAVLAPHAAVSLRLGADSYPLTDGVGVVSTGGGTLTAVDAAGNALGSTSVPLQYANDFNPQQVTAENWG